MFSCYIIDDEEHSIELLLSYIEKTPDLSLSGWSNDPLKGLQEVTTRKPDILFLDVDMPGLSGLDLYRMLGDGFSVIFTTGHAQYAVDAYELAAADFLLKPIRFERFLNAVQRLRLKVKSDPNGSDTLPANAIFLQTGQKGKYARVLINEIIFAESLNNYLKIHLTRGTFIVYMPLKYLAAQLPSSRFERVHKSYIINFERITEMEGNRIWLEGDHEVPVGSQFRERFIERINRKILKK